MIKTPITLIRTIISIMNLQVKQKQKKGLVFLPALFILLFGCEEPSELGVKLNPKEGKISTHYIEIPVEASQLRIDTVVSSSRVTITPNPNNPRLAVYSYSTVPIGKDTDPVFGPVTATAFTNIGTPPDSVLPAVSANAGLDSVVLHLNIDINRTGEDFLSPQDLIIYTLQKAIEPTSGLVEEKAQYKKFISDKKMLNELAEEIGRTSFVIPEVKNSVLRIPIAKDSEFAGKIFDRLKNNQSVLESQKDFNDFIGGLAILPGENNSFINSYFLAGHSDIKFYYGGLKKPVSFPFLPEPGEGKSIASGDYLPTYTYLETDYTNTIFENAPVENNSEFQNPDNQVYYRAGVGLFPKISFSGLEDLAILQSENNIIINKATLEIDSIFNSRGTKTFPNQPHFIYTDVENNKPLIRVSQVAGATLVAGIKRITSEQDTVYSYTADVAHGVEYYIKTRDQDYLQGIVYPSGNSVSLFDFIADPKRMVLKIYYTVLEN